MDDKEGATQTECLGDIKNLIHLHSDRNTLVWTLGKTDLHTSHANSATSPETPATPKELLCSDPEEKFCMFGGKQGKVKLHPFPPCSFLTSVAEHAVYGFFLSTQLRGRGLSLHSHTEFLEHAATLLVRAKKHSPTSFLAPVQALTYHSQEADCIFWQVRVFNGMDIAHFMPVNLCVGD